MKSIIACLIMFLSFGCFGQLDTMGYHGGTYSFGKSAEKGPVGTLEVYPISATKALFYLDVNRGAPSYNMGMLYGEMNIEGPNGTYGYVNEEDDMNCFLQFIFTKNQVVIDYIGEGDDCGFGHAVYANNTYKLVDKEIPQTFIYGDGTELSFVVDNPRKVPLDFYELPDIDRIIDPLASEGLYSVGDWVKNDSLNQILIQGLDDEEGSVFDVHFEIHARLPELFIEQIPLVHEDGKAVPVEKKKEKLTVNSPLLTAVSPEVFTSLNGVKLGDSRTKLIEMYGEPDFDIESDGVGMLGWSFLGEYGYSPYFHEKNVRVAGSFGCTVQACFDGDRLIGYMLHREIP